MHLLPTDHARRSPVPRALALVVGIVLMAVVSSSTVVAQSPPRSGGLKLAHRPTHAVHYKGSFSAKAAIARAQKETGHQVRTLPRLAPRGRHVNTKPLNPRAFGTGLASPRITPRTTTSSQAVSPQLVSPANVVVSSAFFPGLNQSDGGNLEPPDSWVAVNGTYIIQTVNSVYRISNRVGTTIQQIPDWAFFGLTIDQSGTDARMLWDQIHGRWIASNFSFDGTLANNWINLAVSETADPLGVWDQYAFYFGAQLPDFPAIASSLDKVVISVNDYSAGGATYDGAEVMIFDWSALLNPGTFNFVETTPNPGIFTIRPAQALSATTDIHLIFEDNGNANPGNVLYQKIHGLVATGTITFPDLADLTTDLGVTAFAMPVDPRQAGSPATITNMGDERPTDAVWRGNQLWFVSTVPVDFGGGFGPVDGVLARGVTTTATTPTTPNMVLAANDGEDRFMGGIGIAGNGDVVIPFSKSSPSEFVSAKVITMSATYGISDEQEIDTSDGSYTGTRWGDYVGVAADPSGTAAVWLSTETSTAGGDWRTLTRRVISNDFDDPANPVSAPKATIVAPASLPSFTAPVRLTWGASVDVGSGIQYYQLDVNLDGAGFGAGGRFPDRVNGLSAVRALNLGFSYQFRVRSVDWAGNPSAWVTGPTFTPTLIQQTSATFTTGWTNSTSGLFSGGTAKYATAATKYAQFTFFGRAVGFVTLKAISRGSLRVYVDNVYRATVSTYRTTTLARQLVFQYSWPTAGTHRIKLVVLGTSGHPRVDVDAIVVLH